MKAVRTRRALRTGTTACTEECEGAGVGGGGGEKGVVVQGTHEGREEEGSIAKTGRGPAV